MINCRANDAYLYSVVDFCKNFTVAVFAWSEANRKNPQLIANIPRMMQYHPRGLAPYIEGMTVLA